MLKQPVIIASPPRSGTTMLAGLLHHHGLWIGNARVTHFKQTNSDLGTENIEIQSRGTTQEVNKKLKH